MTAAQKMTKARSALILDQPFFGSLALKLILVEDPTCQTLWTDGIHIGYSPKYVDELTMDELKGVLCEEVMHNSNGHQVRRQDREHKKWNQACDYAILQLIQKAGMTIPKDSLVSPAFENMEAEAIYNQLPDSPNGGQKQGTGSGAGNDQGQDGKSSQNLNSSAPVSGGEVRDMPGKDGNKPTEAEKAQNAQDWKIATQQAAQAAKMAGKLPGSLARYVEELLEPVVDWREALRQFVDQIARNDYTWTRPNPRYFSRGLILPSLYNQEIPPLVVAVDTSGSITEKDLQQFASEIDDILNQYPTTLTVIYCDSKVQSVETFDADTRPVRLHAKGGGGTAFSPVWKWIDDQGETPAAAIYLTDMCCSDYGDEPPMPVLWVNTGGYKATPPPFGEIVRLRSEA